MTDTPTQPTAQAMKLGEQLVVGVAALFGLDEATVAGVRGKRAELATAIDVALDLPALLACAEVERDLANDTTTVRGFVGAKLRLKGGIYDWTQDEEYRSALNISTVEIDIDWEISVLPPKVEGYTKGVYWTALLDTATRRATGGYDCIYEITERTP